MKLRVLLCGAALMMVAGCASQQNPFAGSADQVYNYDLVPSPLPDLTPTEVDKINKVNIVTYTVPAHPVDSGQDVSNP